MRALLAVAITVLALALGWVLRRRRPSGAPDLNEAFSRHAGGGFDA